MENNRTRPTVKELYAELEPLVSDPLAQARMEDDGAPVPATLPTLDDYRTMVTHGVCRFCGTGLPDTVLHYPHPGGWPVRGLDGLQWLYLQCVKCEYCWALWKLGVPRAAEKAPGA
jgi:hypothetical protein